MGNAYSYLSSTTTDNPNNTNTNLEEKIKQLEDKINKNNDNIVTKEELNSYFQQLSNKIDNNSDGVISKSELKVYIKEQLHTAEEEVETWKKAYEELNDKYEQLLDNHLIESDNPKIISSISPQALKDYIKTEIIDTDANIGMIPDALEKRVYLAVYKTVMKTLEGLFNTTSIDLLNHRISFAIQPVSIDDRKLKKMD